MRRRGIHGVEAAQARASPERFELPADEEDLDALMILVFERDAYPQRMGQVAALYADVTQGWRSLAGAISVLEVEASIETAPAEYCGRLFGIAVNLILHGRAAEALVLSRLLLAATDAVYGRESEPWIESASAFVQACTASWGTSDPLHAEAESVAEELIERARELGVADLLARALSAAAQLWLRLARDEQGEEPSETLLRTERCLREAADMREGTERGRTLSTLAQLQARLSLAGSISAATVAETARQALATVDRSDRPRQWLTARRLLHQFGDSDEADDPLTPAAVLGIREAHGENVARECVWIEASDLQQRGMPEPAAALLNRTWEPLHVFDCTDQNVLEGLLGAAVHTLDAGAVPCRELDSREAAQLFDQTTSLGADERLAARMHLALHCPGGAPQLAWALRHAPAIVNALEPSALRHAMTFGLALAHGREAVADWHKVPPSFVFRCSLQAAGRFAELNLAARAKDALHIGLNMLAQWTESVAELRSEHEIAGARYQLEGIIDGCLHEAARLDGNLGDMAREWLLQAGRTLCAATRSGPTKHLLLACVHSLAFKGATNTHLLLHAGPWDEDEGSRQFRREIVVLESEETEQALAEEPPRPFDEEVRLSAWVHGAERQSGSSPRQLRRNLQARYDELLLRRILQTRGPSGLGIPELPLEQALSDLAPGTALLDLFLGRDGTGRYSCYATLALPDGWRQSLVRETYEEVAPYQDPTDPHGLLLLDGLAQLVASVRHRVQEPPGARHVSREAAAALMAASQNVLSWGREELDALRDAGCEHLLICPHGPLTFLPFQLLPIENSLLADNLTVTIIPTLGSLLKAERPTGGTAVELGIIAAPEGGVPFGLHAEPRLAEQARELEQLTPGARVYSDGSATPEAALALLAESRYAHIAAHGSGLGQIPSYHCLYLDKGEGPDGRLFAHDIMRADLRSVELVTLCACETALGRVDAAGNLRGMPTALLGAGAQTVVATLWPVAAEPAMHFFGMLHARLAEGAAKLEAFRTAQISCRERYPRFADWGAFTYIGAWR
jgi:hypothetical protein